MVSLILATLLTTAHPSPEPKPLQTLISLPSSDNSLNAMFVADKGGKFKILTLPQFNKELKKCIMLRVDFFDTQAGPLIVFRCEEEK